MELIIIVGRFEILREIVEIKAEEDKRSTKFILYIFFARYKKKLVIHFLFMKKRNSLTVIKTSSKLGDHCLFFII